MTFQFKIQNMYKRKNLNKNQIVWLKKRRAIAKKPIVNYKSWYNERYRLNSLNLNFFL